MKPFPTQSITPLLLHPFSQNPRYLPSSSYTKNVFKLCDYFLVTPMRTGTKGCKTVGIDLFP